MQVSVMASLCSVKIEYIGMISDKYVFISNIEMRDNADHETTSNILLL